MPVSILNRVHFNPSGITNGRQLTSANTGIPSGTSLTTYGGGGSTLPGGTWVNTLFATPPAGFWTLPVGESGTSGAPSSWTNCRIEGGLVMSKCDWTVFDHCEVPSGGVAISSCFNSTWTRCYVHNGSDLLHVTGDQVGRNQCQDIAFVECLADTPAPLLGDHCDGLQIRGCLRLTLTRCALNLGPWFQVGGTNVLNAALFPENANGGNTDLIVDSCYLNGGGYDTYLSVVTGRHEWTNNRFGSDWNFGVLNNPDPVTPTVWTGNVLDSDGSTVNF